MDHRRQALDEQIAREILHSEKLRQTILAMVLTATAPIFFAVLYTNPGRYGSASAELIERLRWTVVCATGLLLPYGWLARRYVIQVLERNGTMPRSLRLLNSIVEVGFVTALILAFAHLVDPVFALTSPPTHLYLVFVMLSILQLDFALCVFTGVASTLAFLATGFFELSQVTTVPSPAILLSPVPVIMKGIFFTMSGIMAGLLAREMRRRMVHAIETMDEKNRAIEMFGRHVSPKVADALLRSGGEFAGELRFVCVMFLDIRDFTRFSEQTPPKDVVAYLDVLFEPLVNIVNRRGGIVNKFLGDGFMAVFGAPIVEGNPCRESILAAVDIVKEVESMTTAGTIPPTRVGIGLHAGEAITGTVGAQSRKEYTVIGDTVNLAARIEQLTKKFGANVLVSDAVWDRAVPLDIPAEIMPPTEVKGREQPVRVYKIG